MNIFPEFYLPFLKLNDFVSVLFVLCLCIIFHIFEYYHITIAYWIDIHLFIICYFWVIIFKALCTLSIYTALHSMLSTVPSKILGSANLPTYESQ